jgi:peptide/nickel transport system permease protein
MILVVPILAVLLAAASAVSKQASTWWAVALLLSAFLWPSVALVVRSTVLSLREQDFIQAQRAAGATDPRIIVRHVIPNAIGPIMVSATLLVVTAILLESSLAFLGFGAAPPDTSLGKLVAIGQPASTNRPWLFYFPGMVLLTICLSLNFIGDGLRSALDPRRSDGGR